MKEGNIMARFDYSRTETAKARTRTRRSMRRAKSTLQFLDMLGGEPAARFVR